MDEQYAHPFFFPEFFPRHPPHIYYIRATPRDSKIFSRIFFLGPPPRIIKNFPEILFGKLWPWYCKKNGGVRGRGYIGAGYGVHILFLTGEQIGKGKVIHITTYSPGYGKGNRLKQEMCVLV